MAETEADQIREYVIRPVLKGMGMYSEAAENLLIGTAAHESNGFSAIRQYGRGPARSVWQIEPATHDDLWEHSIDGIRNRKPDAIAFYEAMVAKQYGRIPPPEYLTWNRAYACATARLLYWRAPFAMPEPDDLSAMAAAWKKYYNTIHGAGHESEWMDAYAEYCF